MAHTVRNRCLSCRELVANKYCNNKCKADHYYYNYIRRWLYGDEVGYRGKSQQVSNHVRRWMLETRNETCERCGFNTPHPSDGKPILQCHHKDGKASNTTPDNLELLCPNCHALTDTFNARNKTSTRRRHSNGNVYSTAP